jgi:DNA end-binding protein Ku
MATTVWKGHLTFGLVSIPVRMVRAARAERVKLRQLYRPNRPAAIEPTQSTQVTQPTPLRHPIEESSPLEETPVAPVERSYHVANGGGQPVSSADLVKGFEYSKGEYVVLEEDEIRAVAPKTSTEMQIVEFVPFGEIDPVYLETSYYVTPDESGEKSYALLFTGMRETGYAAIGQLTMHRRDHVLIVRAGRAGLIAHTMFHSDEVRTLDEFRTDPALVSSKELDLAKALIQALATSFEPAKFKNQFQERLRELIESRASNRQVAVVETPTPAKVIDIMDALKRSLATVKSGQQGEPGAPAKTQRKPARTEPSGKKLRTRGTS